jgi:hypothetical protein
MRFDVGNGLTEHVSTFERSHPSPLNLGVDGGEDGLIEVGWSTLRSKAQSMLRRGVGNGKTLAIGIAMQGTVEEIGIGQAVGPIQEAAAVNGRHEENLFAKVQGAGPGAR